MQFRIHRHLLLPFAVYCVLFAGFARSQSPQPQNPPPTLPPNAIPGTAQSPAPGTPPATNPPANTAPAPPPAAQALPSRPPFAVVLDPGHGGTDSGARGSTGAVEKDLTLAMARVTRYQLTQQSLRVILTREGDENPSFDDRAAVANAPRSAIFVSLHVSSTGQPGTVRAYSYLFSTNPGLTDTSVPETSHPAGRFAAWQTAQQTYVDASHRLADMIQADLAQKFPGSPSMSTPFAVRDLRSVAAPAVAVELSSVSVTDPRTLEPIIAKLAASLAHSVVAFRSTYAAGAR